MKGAFTQNYILRVFVLLFIGWKIIYLEGSCFVSALQTAASFQGDTGRGDSNSCLLGMDSEAKGIHSWNWDFFMLFFPCFMNFG